MNIYELAKQAGFFVADNEVYSPSNQADHELTGFVEAFAELVEAAARSDERNFIATKWENLYGYDKQGVAEFIRKRANTQEETT